jgi:cysteine desulfurase
MNPVYLDCNATTPLEPALGELLMRLMAEEYGNAGSRTHAFGARAKQVVERAREQVAEVVGARRDEVIFTSGATESNNLAVLGLREAAEQRGRRHLITTAIEHKAVLEPMERLERAGFEVTRLAVDASGAVAPAALRQALRPETWLVSIMHVNNETGVRQPLSELARVMDGHPAYLHTDAAQGFGKDLDTLRDPRLDLISISGHKLFAPKGIGALVVRRRGYDRPPLQPLMVGGGQERGLRPGTLPVPLIAVLGAAAELAMRDHSQRVAACRGIREQALAGLMPLGPTLIGDQAFVMDHVLSLAFPGLDSEALMLGLKDLIATSNGSACTSSSYTPSHVLTAMGLGEATVQGAVRISWCHLTPAIDWPAVVGRIRELM